MKKFEPSDLQVAEYYKQGFLRCGRIFEGDKIARIKAHIDNVVANRSQAKRPEQLEMPHVNDAFLLELCSDKLILDVIEMMIGRNIVLFSSHIICKPKGDGLAVPWHQDATYWFLEPMNVVNCWLAIDDSTLENGCMRVIPGSHHAGQLRHETPKVAEKGYLFHEQLSKGRLEEFEGLPIVDIVLRSGEFSLHHHYVVHGSRPNTSDKRRCGYVMRYMPATTKFIRKPNSFTPTWENYPLFLLRGEDPLGNNSYVNV